MGRAYGVSWSGMVAVVDGLSLCLVTLDHLSNSLYE